MLLLNPQGSIFCPQALHFLSENAMQQSSPHGAQQTPQHSPSRLNVRVVLACPHPPAATFTAAGAANVDDVK